MPQREFRLNLGGRLEYRASDSATLGTVTVYAPVFGVLSADFGGWRELVPPWAVTRTLELGHQIAQYNHRDMLGSRVNGTVRMAADERGVRTEIDLPDTGPGRDVATLADRGDLTGASFTFMVRAPSYWTTLGSLRSAGVAGQPVAVRLGADDTDGEPDDNTEIRVLTEVALYEAGPVDMPAYPEPVVSRAREAAAVELAGQRGLNAAEVLSAMEERRLGEILHPDRGVARRGMSLAMARELVDL